MRLWIFAIIAALSIFIAGCADSGSRQSDVTIEDKTVFADITVPEIETVPEAENTAKSDVAFSEISTKPENDTTVSVPKETGTKKDVIAAETTVQSIISSTKEADSPTAAPTESSVQTPVHNQTETTTKAPVPQTTAAPVATPAPVRTPKPTEETSTFLPAAPAETVAPTVPDTFEYRLNNGTATLEEMRQYVLDGVNYSRTTGQNRMGISYCPMTLNDEWSQYAQWYVEYLIRDEAARQSIAEGPNCHSHRIGWSTHNEGIFQVFPYHVEDNARYMTDHCFLYGDDLNEIGIGVAYDDGYWFAVVQTWYNCTLPELPTK